MKLGRIKKHFEVLFVMAALFAVMAVGTPSVSAGPPIEITETYTYINPLYKGLVTPEDLTMPESGDAVLMDAPEFASAEAAAEYLRDQMVARQSPITFQITGSGSSLPDAEALSDQILNRALAPTENSQEGDYLQWQYGSIGYSYYIDGSSFFYTMTFSYEVTYYTTAEQEAAVTSKLAEITPTLKLDGKSDYDKLRTIYDYICENIYYVSDDILHDNDYLLKYTAYDALINHKAVCQGYAVLLYRMLLEAGIDCRVIPGSGLGVNHAWNIVKLGDRWYNLDATWDATLKQENQAYQYFLRCNANFSDHKREEDYTTDAFNAAYPMATSDYVYHTHTPGEAVRENEVAPTCTEGGSYELVTYCTVCHEVVKRESFSVSALGHDLIHHDAQAVTCTEKGWNTYDTCSRCDYTTYAEIPALGHAYGAPSFTWADDYSTATATFICARNASHAQNIAADVTSIHTEATHTSNESIVYTATVVFGDQTYTDTKTVVLTSTGHAYGEPDWTWTADRSTAEATFICVDNDDTQTVTATIITSDSTATASVVFNDVTYQNEQTIPTAIVSIKSDNLSIAGGDLTRDEADAEIIVIKVKPQVDENTQANETTVIAITTDAADTLADNNTGTVIDTPAADITFDKTAMTSIKEAKTTVTLSVQVFDNKDNSDWTKKETVVVVELVDESNKPVLPDTKDNGTITIRIPYDGTGSIQVYYRDEQGKYHWIPDAKREGDYVVFTTNHLSDYVIVEGAGLTAWMENGALEYRVALPQGQGARLLIAWYDDVTGQMKGCYMVAAESGRLTDIHSDCTYKVILVSDTFAPLCPAVGIGTQQLFPSDDAVDGNDVI